MTYLVMAYSRETDTLVWRDVWDMFDNLDDAMYEADFLTEDDTYVEIYIDGTDDRVYTNQYM